MRGLNGVLMFLSPILVFSFLENPVKDDTKGFLAYTVKHVVFPLSNSSFRLHCAKDVLMRHFPVMFKKPEQRRRCLEAPASGEYACENKGRHSSVAGIGLKSSVLRNAIAFAMWGRWVGSILGLLDRRWYRSFAIVWRRELR
jgi:hypothetical protein